MRAAVAVCLPLFLFVCFFSYFFFFFPRMLPCHFRLPQCRPPPSLLSVCFSIPSVIQCWQRLHRLVMSPPPHEVGHSCGVRWLPTSPSLNPLCWLLLLLVQSKEAVEKQGAVVIQTTAVVAAGRVRDNGYQAPLVLAPLVGCACHCFLLLRVAACCWCMLLLPARESIIIQ